MKKAISLCALIAICLTMLSTLTSCEGLFGKVCKATVNGTNLKEYVIVYSDTDTDYSLRAAKYIKDKILDITGADIPLIEDDEPKGEKHEIVVGKTSRAISADTDVETDGLEFVIASDGTDVALDGDYFIIAAAAYYFIETYVTAVDSETTVSTGASVHTPIVKEAKNYILLIGDGMGLYQTKMFEYLTNDYNVSDGEDMFYGYLLPYIGGSRTNSLSGVTDSAAGGTALACGEKTYNEYIGRDKDQNDIKSLTELAIELGMSAGVMSTDKRTGATPAAFSAHAYDRDDDSAILESQNHTKYDIGAIINCGYSDSTQNGMNVIESEIVKTLDKLDDNENGFFFMYEEGYIDKNCHNNDMDATFKTVMRFNQAIARFMEYAFYNPETFILITADHETGGLAPNEDGVLEYSIDDHTGADVLTFAYGESAQLFDGVTVENIQIAHTIASFWGVYDFGDQSQYSYLK